MLTIEEDVASKTTEATSMVSQYNNNNSYSSFISQQIQDSTNQEGIAETA